MSGLRALKADLLSQWDYPRARQEEEEGFAVLQSLGPVQAPRGGLAIGEGIDPASRHRRIEMRLHARSDRQRAKAEQLVSYAQLQGVDAILRVFGARPLIPIAQKKPQDAAALGGSRRPLHIGASIAHEEGSAGTLGAFVRLDEDGGDLGILSCAHVLALATLRRHANIDDPIQQPGRPDALLPVNRIATLTRHFSIFQSNAADNLDAAIAALKAEVAGDVLGNVLPDTACVPEPLRGRRLGNPLLRDEIEPGMDVVKLGRTTGFTRGRLSLIEVENFRPNLGSRGAYTFGSVVEISWRPGEGPFTHSGDSGSLVVTEDGLHPIGIHFCSAPLEPEGWTSYLVPWWRIVGAFPVSFA